VYRYLKENFNTYHIGWPKISSGIVPQGHIIKTQAKTFKTAAVSQPSQPQNRNKNALPVCYSDRIHFSVLGEYLHHPT